MDREEEKQIAQAMLLLALCGTHLIEILTVDPSNTHAESAADNLREAQAILEQLTD